MRDNPGKIGLTTGHTGMSGSYRTAQIDFGPNERPFKRVALLEVMETAESPTGLLLRGRFGGPEDLRRVLTFEKVKGNLTNVFYSMEATRAEFMPHQFKPVLRFVESSVGRLLLADEVGLGKTVEAMYVWKELQARDLARRLLVVCPAMLRDKWRRDMERLFNIDAKIVGAAQLRESLHRVTTRDRSVSFAMVAGIESLRPPRDDSDPDTRNSRAQLARIMVDTPTSGEFCLFDLVIIDEAHSMRNPSTANNRLGRLLRDSARHLLLLTATPVQIGNENLYQLLRLVDEERFSDLSVFHDLLRANRPIVDLMRHAWAVPPDVEAIQHDASQAQRSPYFRDDPVLNRVMERVSGAVELDPTAQVDIARMAESRSLLDQYMCRTRKREVLERRVVRSAQVREVSFSAPEKRVYDLVTDNIRAALEGTQGWQFPLITRQRQMASSLPAAAAAWNSDPEVASELLWDDLGLQWPEDGEQGESVEFAPQGLPPAADIGALECADQKYAELVHVLRETLRSNPREKTVVFAFFRNTLAYLHRRLTADGVSSALLMGSMPDAQEVLARFSRPDGPSVLLSSEVGSEGLDLQFCRCLVNYDLPWNPMKVEQRIGRLDRLGQDAERISIVNLVVTNSIEDRVLQRLYDRIGVFGESIGDLEEILGDRSQQLLFDLLDPRLSEEERMRRAEEAARTIENQRAEQKRLEEESANLYGLSDYINHRVHETRDQQRWLGPADLHQHVDDFFALRYPGTVLDVDEDTHSGTVRLSDDARQDLRDYVTRSTPPTITMLGRSHSSVPVSFDARSPRQAGVGREIIDVAHPLVRWIQECYERAGHVLHPVAATALPQDPLCLGPGAYVYAVHGWQFRGLRQERVLAYQAMRLGDGELLARGVSERLVEIAARQGQPIPNAAGVVEDLRTLGDATAACERALQREFDARSDDFDAENRARCDQHEASTRGLAERKITALEARIARLDSDGRRKTLPAERGKIQKVKDVFADQMRRIDSHRVVDTELVELGIGLVRIG